MSVPSFGYDLTGLGASGPATSEDLGKAKPIGRDIELDKASHDLRVYHGDLQIVRDVPAIRQEADMRMQFFLEEWFLDKTAGIPYFQNVLVKAPNLAAIRTVFRDEILNTAGIRSLTKLELDFNASTRKLTVTWSATTDLGELAESEVSF